MGRVKASDKEIEFLIEKYIAIFTRFRRKPVEVTFKEGKFHIQTDIRVSLPKKRFIEFTDNLEKWELDSK